VNALRFVCTGKKVKRIFGCFLFFFGEKSSLFSYFVFLGFVRNEKKVSANHFL